MHEAAFAQAAIPSPTVVLGLPLKPYSIGHELWLIRQGNPLAVGGNILPAHVYEAVLLCAEDWKSALALNRDWLISLKLKLWRARTARADIVQAAADFQAYRKSSSAWLPSPPTTPKGEAHRPPGAPFLLRLIQFLVREMRVSLADAYDFPLGLAQMHYCAFGEDEGRYQVWNEHDEEFAKYIAAEEAKSKEEKCQA